MLKLEYDWLEYVFLVWFLSFFVEFKDIVHHNMSVYNTDYIWDIIIRKTLNGIYWDAKSLTDSWSL